MSGLNGHHKVPKGMGGSKLRDEGWNRAYMSWRNHMGTHRDGKKMRQGRNEAGDRLLRQLKNAATAGMVGEGEVRLVMGWTAQKYDDQWYRLWKQLPCGHTYWPVEDVARALMGGKLYASVI